MQFQPNNLLNYIHKFVIKYPKGSAKFASFAQQPYAHLFTAVAGISIIDFLEQTQKISPQLAARYPLDFRFTAENLEQHQELITALRPYFDLEELYRNSGYTNFVSIQDINEGISNLNLLQHIVNNNNIAEDEWVLICEDDVVLNPSWTYRLEGILRALVPYSKFLSEKLQMFKEQEAEAKDVYARTLATKYHVTDYRQFIPQQSFYQNRFTYHKAQQEALQRVNFIALTSCVNHSFEQHSVESLNAQAIYPSQLVPIDLTPVVALKANHFQNKLRDSYRQYQLTQEQQEFWQSEQVLEAPSTEKEAISKFTVDFTQKLAKQNLRKFSDAELASHLATATSSQLENLEEEYSLDQSFNRMRLEQKLWLEQSKATPIPSSLRPLSRQAIEQAQLLERKLNLFGTPDTAVQSLASCNLLNFTSQSFYLVKKSGLADFFKQLPYVSALAPAVKFDPNSAPCFDFAPTALVEAVAKQQAEAQDQEPEHLIELNYQQNAVTNQAAWLMTLEPKILALRNQIAELEAQQAEETKPTPSKNLAVEATLAEETSAPLEDDLLFDPNAEDFAQTATTELSLVSTPSQLDPAVVAKLEQLRSELAHLEQDWQQTENLLQQEQFKLEQLKAEIPAPYSYQVAGSTFDQLVKLQLAEGKGGYFLKDFLHMITQFGDGSLAYANPFLGIQTHFHGEEVYVRESLRDLSNLAGKVLDLQPSTQEFKTQGHDYVARYKKYVLADYANPRFIANFMTQPYSQGFKLVACPNPEQFSLAQREDLIDHQAYAEHSIRSKTPSDFIFSRTLAQRQVFQEVIENELIADSDFIILADDFAQLHPNWYELANDLFRYISIARPDLNLLLLSNRVKSGFHKVTGDKAVYNENEFHYLDANSILEVTSELELILNSTYRKFDYPFIAIRKSALKGYLKNKGLTSFKQDKQYIAYLYSNLIPIYLGTMALSNPPLGLDRYYPSITEHGSVNLKQDYSLERSTMTQYALNHPNEVTEQANTRLVDPDNEITALDHYQQVAVRDLRQQALRTPELDPSQGLAVNNRKNKMFDVGELVLKVPTKFELEQQVLRQQDKPFGWSPVGLQEDLVAKVKKYVINLKSSTDRLESFLTQPNVDDFIIHPAIPGSEFTPERITHYFDKETLDNRYQRTLHVNELGCALSHAQILRQALHDPELGADDWVMIVEDDTRLNPNWYRLLNNILIYVRDNLGPRPQIINGAQNQLQHFKNLSPEKFVTTHVLNSSLRLYHQITPEVGIGITESDYPAGAGFYLVRKQLLLDNRERIEGKIDWVADDVARFYNFREGLFAYTNPQLGFDDPELRSILDEDRLSSLEQVKIARRSIPINNPHPYLNHSRIYVLQRTLSDQQLAEHPLYKHCSIIPFVDYAALPREQQEELFDFKRFKETYGYEISPEQLNRSLQHQKLLETVCNLNTSDFVFFMAIEDDVELTDNLLHKANCICDFTDTRIDLDTIMIFTSNDVQPQNFAQLSTAEEFAKYAIYTEDERIWNVNQDLKLCLTHTKSSNGGTSYIFLKFLTSHLAQNPHKPFYLAGDYMFVMNYNIKSIAFCSPMLAIRKSQ